MGQKGLRARIRMVSATQRESRGDFEPTFRSVGGHAKPTPKTPTLQDPSTGTNETPNCPKERGSRAAHSAPPSSPGDCSEDGLLGLLGARGRLRRASAFPLGVTCGARHGTRRVLIETADPQPHRRMVPST